MWTKNDAAEKSFETTLAAKISSEETEKYIVPILHPRAKSQAEMSGCIVKGKNIIGSIGEMTAFMQLQNPMHQMKYNKALNGSWNALSRTIHPMPRPISTTKTDIIFSASMVLGDKATSTGFMTVVAGDFSSVLRIWKEYSISSAIFSPILRFTHGNWKWDYRRREHNISFIGNVFIYDFDDGKISMDEFHKKYEGKFDFMATKSKSDHKYPHDRFKVIVKHNTIFTHKNNDEAPEGYSRSNISQYQGMYVGFAEHFDFWKYADPKTKDLPRLSAHVAPKGESCLSILAA